VRVAQGGGGGGGGGGQLPPCLPIPLCVQLLYGCLQGRDLDTQLAFLPLHLGHSALQQDVL